MRNQPDYITIQNQIQRFISASDFVDLFESLLQSWHDRHRLDEAPF
ncbi:MAG TPA: hypothetical protein VFZ59_19625 [Verrucomicrobiae bacterium]|nr:hypothetical protein [Verrucomicrobiae bacterium]